jgi:hypothetical protein
VVIKQERGKKMSIKELAFKTALLFKFLPNVKRVEIYGDSNLDILCYVLVLSQTNEKYGKQILLYALIQSNFHLAAFRQIEEFSFINYTEIYAEDMAISKRSKNIITFRLDFLA